MQPGQKLGPYELLSPIGAGGMGQVWKARDTRLGREVALKTIGEQFSGRFRREAESISVLNHPNICTLYDVGTNYLVMELIEGETIASLLRKGPLGFDRTLRYGQQVAAALAAAHARGIVHRDLKPGNIMVTKNGVKVLDFGLAKRASPDAAEQVETATASHIIVGTPAYMAPEQLEGKVADARTDIFALGIVLYEMAAGTRPFAGENHAALIAGILRGDAAPIENAPPKLAHVVERCLAKDPDARWQSASDVKHELEWAATGATLPAPPAAQSRWRRWLGLAALAAIALGAGGAALWFRRTGFEERVYRFNLAPPPDTEFLSAPNRTGLALSPDGRTLVFLGVRRGQPRLWLQRLDSNTAHEIPGTDNASEPFWSPDGRSLGFYAGPSLNRIDTDGANLQVLAKASAPRGGYWGPDGTILFSPSIAAAIYRVSGTGGEAVRITSADLSRGASYHSYPILLDDGKHFLYSITGAGAGVYVSSLDKTAEKTLVLNFAWRVAVVRPRSSGRRYLVWERGDSIVAQRWESLSAKPSGEIVPLAVASGRFVTFAVSDSGLLVYGNEPSDLQVQSVDRTGKTLAVLSDTESWISPAQSPDGNRVAVVNLWNQNVTLTDLQRDVTSRVATGGVRYPVVWSPDGSRLGYARAGSLVLYAVDGGKETVLATSPHTLTFQGWMPDGRAILYGELGPDGKRSIWVRPVEAGVPARRLLSTRYDESHPAVSADGKWLAYVTDESGRSEVYAQALGGGPRVQVSSQGGNTPKWRRDGRELFYQAIDGSLVSVGVKPAGDRLDLSMPRVLFSLPAHYVSGYSYDASADGQRFLVLAPYRRQPREPLTVVANWPALLPN